MEALKKKIDKIINRFKKYKGVRVSIFIHDYMSWDEFMNEYKHKLGFVERCPTSTTCFYVGRMTIDGVEVEVFGPYFPNPSHSPFTDTEREIRNMIETIAERAIPLLKLLIDEHIAKTKEEKTEEPWKEEHKHEPDWDAYCNELKKYAELIEKMTKTQQ